MFRIQSADGIDKKRYSDLLAETDEWTFSSTLRQKEEKLQKKQKSKKVVPAPGPPKAKKAPAPTLEDYYYRSLGLADGKGPELVPISESESTKSDYPELFEEMAQHELTQRNYQPPKGGKYQPPDYTKYPKYPKYPKNPYAPEEPDVPPPPVNPPPVNPPPVTPPPVTPPPVTPPPVTPPPVDPPPVVPPPVVKPPVVPPPVVPPPVVPPPVVPPPVVPPPVVPPPVIPPPVVPPPVVPPPVVPPPVVPPPVNPPPVNPPPVNPPPGLTDFYDISVRQIPQPVLPATPNLGPPALKCPVSFTATNVLAYGPANIPGQLFHNWPGFTIEALVSGKSCYCFHSK